MGLMRIHGARMFASPMRQHRLRHRHSNGSDDLRNSSGTTTEHAHRIEHSIRRSVASG
jgi:hypothetical protein